MNHYGGNFMELKKLDKWAELLLDTGKRNNLINFKDTKNSSVEVLLPSSDIIFEKLQGETVFEVYDPKLPEEGDETENEPQEQAADSFSAEAADDKAAYLAEYSHKLRRQNQILLYNIGKKPIVAITNIWKKARTFIEETGVNVAYMAFGFVHWKESDSSEITYSAPLLLVPIQIDRPSIVLPLSIKSTDEDIIVNPTFAYKLSAEYGVELPNYSDEGLTAYLNNVWQLVHKLHWSVSHECKIGIFSFLKINMYRDLKDNSAAILANPNVRQLLGEPIPTAGDSAEKGLEPTGNPIIKLHNVVDADSSQIDAIELAKTGKSFVLQGPPGTGKSQTISNIIAECLSDGKKVLFVSEKLAALNVVYDKLKQAGLSEFCLELHSHKANKKDIINDICHTLHMGRSAVSSKAEEEIAAKEKAQKQLDAYALELHKQRPVIGKSLYELNESYSAFRLAPDIDWTVPALNSKDETYLAETVSLLEQYVDYIPSIGYNYKNNPWYGYINQDTSYQAKAEVKKAISASETLFEALIPLQQEIAERYGIICNTKEDAQHWKSFFDFASTSEILLPALLSKENFEKAKTAFEKLHNFSTEIESSRAKLIAVCDDEIFKIDGCLYNKKLTKLLSGFFSRIFSSDYKRLINDLRLCKKDGKKPHYKEAVALTEELANYQQNMRAFAGTENRFREFLGRAYKGLETDWDYVLEQISAFEKISGDLAFGNLDEFGSFVKERSAFAGYGSKIETAFSLCDSQSLQLLARCFDESILDIDVTPSSLVLARMKACLQEMDKLDNWCHFNSLLNDLNAKQAIPYLNLAIQQNIEAKYISKAFQKQFYFQWIDTIISSSSVLSSFSRISQDKAIKIFSEKDAEHLEINKAKIRAELSSLRPALDVIAPGSALSTILREGEKKRKQKPIRLLLMETGELIQRLKPCFLMSPLSVSTYLAPDAVHFDTVIFDEASQIFPQDAIGAIYRGKQLIVVGDSKQMPPSNFFNASLDADDDDEETGDVTDFESILDLCSTSMQQMRLRWHYRSRYEQLISFSNKNFYDNDLVTFPSAKSDAPGIGVDYFHVDGCFDRKSHTNRKESEFVVDLIYKHIKKYPSRSLGVVAFSIAQQDLIDKLLTKRRQNAPEQEFFFRNDAKEPFFIKNLETVQGDERDTIIFSIAYGFDAQGVVRHNFGPLNRVGGERRLNVAVTRAKTNIQIVSSMHYTDIDLKRTSAEGARLLREYLDYAENGEIALTRAVNVNRFDHYDSDFEQEVCEFLREKGFDVDTQVGCSGFRIDLGVKIPHSSNYVLAIECDGATYHSAKNARDRDRLRQEILERMGWKFYRIWSTDWFRNKPVEQLRLLEVAGKAVMNPECEKKETASPSRETYEEEAAEKYFAFPPYKAADIHKLSEDYDWRGFQTWIKAILDIEAPLSEELLLKRIAWYFGRQKVTSVVKDEYDQKMQGCSRNGIIQKGGFLYLHDQDEIHFRGPGDLKREISQIAPEELADGMYQILQQNITAEKEGLFRSLALQCGITRVGKDVWEHMERALRTLNNKVIVDDQHISLK